MQDLKQDGKQQEESKELPQSHEDSSLQDETMPLDDTLQELKEEIKQEEEDIIKYL